VFYNTHPFQQHVKQCNGSEQTVQTSSSDSFSSVPLYSTKPSKNSNCLTDSNSHQAFVSPTTTENSFNKALDTSENLEIHPFSSTQSDV